MFNIYNTGVIFEIAGCLFKWAIFFIVLKIWNTWNFQFLDCFWKKLLKTRLNLLSFEINSISLVGFICSFLENLFENNGRTIFQIVRLSITLLVSILLKYVLLVFCNSFWQKMRCDVYALLSEKVFDFKNLFLSLDLFIMALCSTYHKWSFICTNCTNIFSFNRGMFIENTEDCILETFQVRSSKIKFAYIRSKLFIAKIFIVVMIYYFRLQFLEAHSELSDGQ